MLLKTNQKNVWGGMICLPIIGETKVEENGTIDVSEEVAELLLNGSNWEDATENKKDEEDSSDNLDKGGQKSDKVVETAKKSTKTSSKTPKTEQVKTEKVEGEKSEEDKQKELMINALETMSLNDMITLAETSKIKGYHLFKSDEKKMRAFMKKKLE